MLRSFVRLILGVSLLLLTSLPAFTQSTGRQSAAKERAEGDPNGAIRALGATGFNDRGDAKPPPVDVPRLDEGPAGTSGVPRGTLSSGRH